jgi:hypothetical protein
MLTSGGTIRLTRQCSGAFAEAWITVAPITERSNVVRLRSSPHAMAGFPSGARRRPVVELHAARALAK